MEAFRTWTSMAAKKLFGKDIKIKISLTGCEISIFNDSSLRDTSTGVGKYPEILTFEESHRIEKDCIIIHAGINGM